MQDEVNAKERSDSITAVCDKYEVGETHVCHWKSSKTAVFMLGFDDSAPTQLDYVIPLLKVRGIPASYYINPGNGPFRNRQADWKCAAQSELVELCNHTFSHRGAMSVEEFEQEILSTNAVIDALCPGRPRRRFRGFGLPVLPQSHWGISGDQIRKTLKKHLMVDRPPLHGPCLTMNTDDELMQYLDSIMMGEEPQQLVFHGVGGDWYSISISLFIDFIDKLESYRDDLWITDPVSCHKYSRERDSASVRTVLLQEDRLELELTCQVSPVLYDLPLSLITALPGDWSGVQITQGHVALKGEKAQDRLMFDALPGGDVVVIERL